MYCQKCGMKLSENDKFCRICGTKVYATTLQSEVTQEIMEEVKAEVKECGETLRKGNKKSKKKLLGIIAGVFVMLAVVLGVFFAYLENRTLYTLVNPELFFGECTTILVMKDTPGESGVVLFFESDTAMWEEIIWYTNAIDQIDQNLQAYYDNDPRTDAAQETAYSDSWHYWGNAFWSGYSLMDSKRVVTLEHFEENEKYVVKMYVEGYQNCEFLDVNPYTGQKTSFKENSSTSEGTEHEEQPTMPPTITIKPQAKATATPKPTSKPKTTATPVPTKAPQLVAKEIDTATVVKTPKNAFQDFAAWSKGKAVTKNMEEKERTWQSIEYKVNQDTVELYMEMLKQNGFTEVDSYFFQYRSDPFVSWGFNCDYLPNADKVDMQYKDDVYCHLCIWSSDSDEFHLAYSSDLTQYDLGLRMDGSVADISVKGKSAGAGLYRMPDGTYQTSDGRLSAALNTAMILRDEEAYYCTARNEKNPDKLQEWLWLDDYYRSEGICFMVPMNYLMAGDIFQYSDFERDRYYNDPNDKTDIDDWKWGDRPLFLMSVNGGWVGPMLTKSKIEEVTVRVMYYEKNVEAVYYIYAKTSGTPSEIEALCAVSLSAEVGKSFDDTIYLSKGDTYTIHFSNTEFGAKSNVYEWEVTDGNAVYIDGVSANCEVTAMKAGEATVTLQYRYTVDEPDVLTGLPSTGFKSKTRVYRFVVE